jgi:hypothetical protein
MTPMSPHDANLSPAANRPHRIRSFYPMKKTPSSAHFGIKKTRMISQPKPAFFRHYQLPRSVEAALVLVRNLNARIYSP